MKKLKEIKEPGPAQENRAKINEIIDSLGKRGSFTPPTPQEVESYARQYATDNPGINGNISGKAFCDFYESKGWKIGSVKMKSWKATVRRCVCAGWAKRIPSDRGLDAKKLRDKAYADEQARRVRRDFTDWLTCKSTPDAQIVAKVKAYPPLRQLAMELRPELFKESKDE